VRSKSGLTCHYERNILEDLPDSILYVATSMLVDPGFTESSNGRIVPTRTQEKGREAMRA
jgi:hypothetical protein